MLISIRKLQREHQTIIIIITADFFLSELFLPLSILRVVVQHTEKEKTFFHLKKEDLWNHHGKLSTARLCSTLASRVVKQRSITFRDESISVE